MEKVSRNSGAQIARQRTGDFTRTPIEEAALARGLAKDPIHNFGGGNGAILSESAIALPRTHGHTLPVVLICRNPTPLPAPPNHWHFSVHPVPIRGAYASSRTLERDAVDAAATRDERR
jgi:hypothetical protein